MCAGLYCNIAGEFRVCSCVLNEITDRVDSRFIDLDPGVRPLHLRTRED
jgi:hypothetical protein